MFWLSWFIFHLFSWSLDITSHFLLHDLRGNILLFAIHFYAWFLYLSLNWLRFGYDLLFLDSIYQGLRLSRLNTSMFTVRIRYLKLLLFLLTLSTLNISINSRLHYLIITILLIILFIIFFWNCVIYNSFLWIAGLLNKLLLLSWLRHIPLNSKRTIILLQRIRHFIHLTKTFTKSWC
jgi:hypothetical protein